VIKSGDPENIHISYCPFFQAARDPFKTAGMVFQKISKSSRNDHLSIYSMSSFIQN
jgi:hypothetical protein